MTELKPVKKGNASNTRVYSRCERDVLRRNKLSRNFIESIEALSLLQGKVLSDDETKDLLTRVIIFYLNESIDDYLDDAWKCLHSVWICHSDDMQIGKGA